MPRTEDGDYELILGNRQLLSIFFIVVVLLGAGFTLGYLLGRESAQPAQVAVKAAEAASDKLPEPIADPPRAAEPAPATAEPAVSKPSAVPPADARPTPAGAYKTGVPPPGTSFIQVAAVAKRDAEAQAQSLAEKGFPMWVAPNEKNPELFSVLAGPYAERADLAKAKIALEELGFRKTFRKDYK
jgi:cell division septation protein DedD